MATATCHTEGCGNAGVPIDFEPPLDLDTGEPYPPPYNVSCGACGHMIEDIDNGEPEPEPEPPDEIDNTLPEGPPDRADNTLPEHRPEPQA